MCMFIIRTTVLKTMLCISHRETHGRLSVICKTGETRIYSFQYPGITDHYGKTCTFGFFFPKSLYCKIKQKSVGGEVNVNTSSGSTKCKSQRGSLVYCACCYDICLSQEVCLWLIFVKRFLNRHLSEVLSATVHCYHQSQLQDPLWYGWKYPLQYLREWKEKPCKKWSILTLMWAHLPVPYTSIGVSGKWQVNGFLSVP